MELEYLISAFTMINSQSGNEGKVYEKLVCIPGVKYAYQVFGVYDINLRIEEIDLESLHEKIILQIRSIKEILSTLTLIILS